MLNNKPSGATSTIHDTVLINGQLVTKTMKLVARPQGDKQYISLDADNFPLESAAWHIEDTCSNYLRQRKFRLKVDPAIFDRGIRGLVEGTSVDELMKNLALRSGTKAVQDAKDPNTWVLKP